MLVVDERVQMPDNSAVPGQSFYPGRPVDLVRGQYGPMMMLDGLTVLEQSFCSGNLVDLERGQYGLVQRSCMLAILEILQTAPVLQSQQNKTMTPEILRY